MKYKLLVPIVLVVALITVPSFAKDVSVGDFALKYAQSLGIKVITASDAMRVLGEKGLLSRELRSESVLTEKDLIDIFQRAGIDSTTVNPAQSVDENAANAALASLTSASHPDSSSSNSKSSSKGDDDANNNGRKTRPKGQEPNSRANPNAFYGRDDEG